MKKCKVRVKRWHEEWVEYNGWTTATEGIVCYNQDPKDHEGPAHKMPWRLIHVASGMGIASVYTRAQAQELAELLAPTWDWTLDERQEHPEPTPMQVITKYMTDLATAHLTDEDLTYKEAA